MKSAQQIELETLQTVRENERFTCIKPIERIKLGNTAAFFELDGEDVVLYGPNCGLNAVIPCHEFFNYFEFQDRVKQQQLKAAKHKVAQFVADVVAESKKLLRLNTGSDVE